MNRISLFSFPLIALLIATFSSCKSDDSEINAGRQFSLSEPTVFIPVGKLKLPQGVAVDASGNVWVSDTRTDRIRQFSASGTQTDSITDILPSRIAIHKSTGDLLVMQNRTTVSRFIIPTKTLTASYSLSPFIGDASAVFDINTRSSMSITIDVRDLGDIDSSPTGDIFVIGRGTPENFIVRVQNGNVSAIVSSSVVPSDSSIAGARFLAADRFGTLFASFTSSRGPSAATFVYSVTPGSITQSHILSEPVVSSAARGAAVDNDGNLYITDPFTQELIIVSTASERTLFRYRIPDTNGFSMAPQDAAVATDGTVYVVVNDRLGTDAGAVLKYTRASR